MTFNKRINSIVIYFQPEEGEPSSSMIFDDTNNPGVVDGIMRQFRAHEDIVVILANRDTVVIPFYSILTIVTQFEINEVTITDDVCRPYSGGGGSGGETTVVVTIANFSGDDMPAGIIIYAESIENLMNNVYNEVEAIANGATKDIGMNPGWVIAFMAEIDPSTVAGTNLTLNDAGGGHYYWTIGDAEDYADFTITTVQ